MKKIAWNEDWCFTKQKSGKMELVTLPHDAMLREKRSKEEASGAGAAYFAGGFYTYEKAFNVPEEWKDKKILLQFGGVYRKAKVELNGKCVAECSYGYLPFWADLSHDLKVGEQNLIRVTADNTQTPNSRWYSGAGIYRPVWLWMGDKSHICPEGVRITTLQTDPARIRVQIETEDKKAEDEICVEILDGEGIAVSASGTDVCMEIENAKLWSAECPNLYQCRVSLKRDGEVLDSMEQRFGIRSLSWSVEGFFVNGKETLLKGGCVHHDNGVLGACSYREAELRKVRILKEAGFNALRSAHNPMGEELLEACDELGMYVMDEAWDMWYKTKTAYDYANDFPASYRQDIETMTRRDYNHPSVVLYSIGNEITEPSEERGNELAKELVGVFHRMDESRPTTVGFNLVLTLMAAKQKAREQGEDSGESSEEKEISSAEFNNTVALLGKRLCQASNMPEADEISTPCLDAVDIAGYNYAQGRYEMDQKLHPNRVIVGSETYPQDLAENWELVKKLPYVIGDFMWTAWDYIGETGIGAWSYQECGNGFVKPYPWLLGDTGAFDILGDATGEAALAETVFKEGQEVRIFVKPVNHPGIEPAKGAWRGTNSIESWSWMGCEGNPAEVEVYTNAPEVELYVNGTCIGREKTVQETASALFHTAYEPGTITAIACDGAVQKGQKQLHSAEGARRITIRPEKNTVAAGELLFVKISICGQNGEIESNADDELTLQVEGGELLGFGSANPRTEESFLTGRYTTYYGRALAVIRAGKTGKVTISATGKRYEEQSAEIPVKL